MEEQANNFDIKVMTNHRSDKPNKTTVRITDKNIQFQPEHTYNINYKIEKEFENKEKAILWVSEWLMSNRMMLK